MGCLGRGQRGKVVSYGLSPGLVAHPASVRRRRALTLDTDEEDRLWPVVRDLDLLSSSRPSSELVIVGRLFMGRRGPSGLSELPSRGQGIAQAHPPPDLVVLDDQHLLLPPSGCLWEIHMRQSIR